MHCQQWAFFQKLNKRVHRIKEPSSVAHEEGGGLCWDSYALVVRFGDVPALVVEDDGDNRVSLSVTSWQEKRWGATCHLQASFKPRLDIAQSYCAQNRCASLDREAVAIAEWYRGFSPRGRYPQKGVDQRLVRLAEQLPKPHVIPDFGKTSSNPYSEFSQEDMLVVRVNGQDLLAMVGGGSFGWRDYRGNLVAFWREDQGKLVPVASFQIGLGDGKPISIKLAKNGAKSR